MCLCIGVFDVLVGYVVVLEFVVVVLVVDLVILCI